MRCIDIMSHFEYAYMNYYECIKPTLYMFIKLKVLKKKSTKFPTLGVELASILFIGRKTLTWI